MANFNFTSVFQLSHLILASRLENTSESITPHRTVLTCETVALHCYKTFYNNNRDQMEDCFLSLCFEPRSMKPLPLYSLTIIYCLIFLFGVVGNVTTCFVMTSADKRSPSSTSRYLANLAAADLISLLSGVPFEIYLGWNQYPWHPPDFVCHLKAWILETTSYVSVLTILAFSIERYLAICHSFAATSTLSGYRRRISYVLPGLWIVAGVSATPYGFYHQADYVLSSWPSNADYGPIKRTKMCMFALAFDPRLKTTFEILFHTSASMFFFIPLLILVFLYWRMAGVIKRSRREVRSFRCATQKTSVSTNVMSDETLMPSSNTDNATHGQSRKISTTERHTYSRKTFYMLASVVVSFFFCYAPYQIHRLLFFYIDDNSSQQIHTYFYFISGVMFYLSSVINPILYSVLSFRFRAAFAKILRACENSAGIATMRLQSNSVANRDHHYSLVPTKRTRTPSPTMPAHL